MVWIKLFKQYIVARGVSGNALFSTVTGERFRTSDRAPASRDCNSTTHNRTGDRFCSELASKKKAALQREGWATASATRYWMMVERRRGVRLGEQVKITGRESFSPEVIDYGRTVRSEKPNERGMVYSVVEAGETAPRRSCAPNHR